ncbi:hypothetical protein HELRODRAFT_182101 [Helobdella robusta]|uniref:Enkurin domain-containing protein n=1 Tax=Helobdella robusta TaxID=6412 RepID=T1FHR2_HELRO|nr:hypothetical protein HELRODRAFT_182101 [Helobdella robusta]ESN91245.1 hypothetical protein HELRODRAFT_182101 [Helobdella robusta]
MPVKAMWKSCKYDNVESKLREYLEVNFPSSTGDNKNSRVFSSRPLSKSDSGMNLNLSSAKSNVDFIKLNGCAARNTVRRCPSTPNLKDSSRSCTRVSHQTRQIPQYLIERKEEWRQAEETRRRINEEKLIPAGQRLMSEDDGISTLQQTTKKREDIVKQLSHLPLRNDTMKLQKLREDLEQKLAKLDDAVRIFSRSKVSVRMER